VFRLGGRIAAIALSASFTLATFGGASAQPDGKKRGGAPAARPGPPSRPAAPPPAVARPTQPPPAVARPSPPPAIARRRRRSVRLLRRSARDRLPSSTSPGKNVSSNGCNSVRSASRAALSSMRPGGVTLCQIVRRPGAIKSSRAGKTARTAYSSAFRGNRTQPESPRRIAANNCSRS